MKNKIIEAGINLKTILIDYTEKDGSNEGWREIEPYSFRPGNLFFGYDIRKGGTRSFKIDRINKLEITNNNYVPKWNVEF
ncbi:MAG: hypothetical protein Q7V19_18235 [Bacteroidales bacterium]|nr:hypothetical protein [Bacteroidales bacterium]